MRYKIGDYIRGKNTRDIFKVVGTTDDYDEPCYVADVVVVSSTKPPHFGHFGAARVGQRNYIGEDFAVYVPEAELLKAILTGDATEDNTIS